MKISFVIQDLCGEGAEYATALMVRGFCARGYEVDLLLSQVHKMNVESGEVPFDIPSETNIIMLPSLKARYNIIALRRYLKTTNSNAVVAMSGNYETALALASIGLLRCPKLYTVEHGIRFALDANCQYAEKAPWWDSERLRRRFIYHFYTGILAVSSGVKRELIRMYDLPQGKISVVYNPVVDEVFDAKITMGARHPWLIDKKCVTIVSAGTLSQAKDHRTLLEAVRRINVDGELRLIIFGEGPYRSEYECFIKSNKLEDWVSLPGFTNNLPAEVKAADGYVSSSKLESFGIAIVEALACGVPVVSTDAPCGPSEILEDGKNGLLVATGDVDGLVSALYKLIQNKVSKPVPDSWRRYKLNNIVVLYEEAIGLHQK